MVSRPKYADKCTQTNDSDFDFTRYYGHPGVNRGLPVGLKMLGWTWTTFLNLCWTGWGPKWGWNARDGQAAVFLEAGERGKKEEPLKLGLSLAATYKTRMGLKPLWNHILVVIITFDTIQTHKFSALEEIFKVSKGNNFLGSEESEIYAQQIQPLQPQT